MERLDKLLSSAGNFTRSEARKIIKSGRLRVDNAVIRDFNEKVPDDAELVLDGTALGKAGFSYYMLNKPVGVLSATEDRTGKTVLDLLPENQRRGLFPVGRLDKEVTGLLIITDDGDFGHSVTSPKKQIPKVYEVNAVSELTGEDVRAFSEGITLRDGTKCLPAKLTVDENLPQHAFVEIFEGKYHQVKRMFASRAKPVENLRRISIGGLKLDDNLPEGSFRKMEKDEALLVFRK